MTAGIFSQFSFGIESSYGTKAAATHILEAAAGSGIQYDPNIQEVDVINGQLAKRSCTFPGESTIEGSLEVPFYPAVVPYLFYCLFGSVATTAYQQDGDTVAGVYSHVFSENPERPTFTLEQQVGDLATVVTGVQPTSLELTAESGAVINTKFDVFGKTIEVLSDPTTATAAAGCPLDHTHDITLSVDGVEIANVKSLTFSYQNNVTAEHTLTSGAAVGMRGIGKTEYEGEMTLILDNTAASEYQKYLNGDKRAVVLTISGNKIGNTDVKQQLILNLPLVQFSKFEVPSTQDTVTATVGFKGLYDKTTGTHFGLTVINEVSSLAS